MANPAAKRPPRSKTPGQHGGARPGCGRKRFEPTDSQRQIVAILAHTLTPQDLICEAITWPPGDYASAGKPINKETLLKVFAAELKGGEKLALSRVHARMYATALSDAAGAVTAGIFILKARAGWRDGHFDAPTEDRTVKITGGLPDED